MDMQESRQQSRNTGGPIKIHVRSRSQYEIDYYAVVRVHVLHHAHHMATDIGARGSNIRLTATEASSPTINGSTNGDITTLYYNYDDIEIIVVPRKWNGYPVHCPMNVSLISPMSTMNDQDL
jgi:hypothetical protein